MTTKINQLQLELLTNLSQHHNAPSDPIIANTAFSLAVEGFEELKKFPTKLPFRSDEDQYLYYDTLFPLFASSYQYLGKVSWALDVKSVYGREIYSDFVVQELDQVTKSLKYHLHYTQYSSLEPPEVPYANPVNQPAQARKNKSQVVGAVQQLQLAFNSPNLKALVDYKTFLEKQKKDLDAPPDVAIMAVYEFVGSQADAMEVIEGWTAMKVIKINGEYANLRQVAEMWTSWFRKPIPNIYSKKRINHSRKKEAAPFITKMAQVLRESAARQKTKRG
jgi:hypothetical protein